MGLLWLWHPEQPCEAACWVRLLAGGPVGCGTCARTCCACMFNPCTCIACCAQLEAEVAEERLRFVRLQRQVAEMVECAESWRLAYLKAYRRKEDLKLVLDLPAVLSEIETRSKYAVAAMASRLSVIPML